MVREETRIFTLEPGKDGEPVLPGSRRWFMVIPMSAGIHWQDFSAAFGRAAEAAGFSRTLLEVTTSGPLEVWERRSAGPRVYLSSGIHGDEPAGPLAILNLMEEGFFADGLVDWVLCPALN